MKQMILAVILTMWSVTAHAANWVKIYNDPEIEISIDAETIEFGKNTVTYWQMDNLLKAEKFGTKPYLSRVTKQHTDFNSRTNRLLFITIYSGSNQSGKTLFSENYDIVLSEARPVVPGSLGAQIHDFMKVLYAEKQKSANN